MRKTRKRSSWPKAGQAPGPDAAHAARESLRATLSSVGTTGSILRELHEKRGVALDGTRVSTILHPRGLPAFAELGAVMRLRDLRRLHASLQDMRDVMAALEVQDGLELPPVADLDRAVASVQEAIARLSGNHPDLGAARLPKDDETAVGLLQRTSYVRARSATLYDYLASAIPSPMPQRRRVARRAVPVAFNTTALQYTARLVNAEFWPAVTLTAATLKSRLQHRAKGATKNTKEYLARPPRY